MEAGEWTSKGPPALPLRRKERDDDRTWHGFIIGTVNNERTCFLTCIDVSLWNSMLRVGVFQTLRNRKLHTSRGHVLCPSARFTSWEAGLVALCSCLRAFPSCCLYEITHNSDLHVDSFRYTPADFCMEHILLGAPPQFGGFFSTRPSKTEVLLLVFLENDNKNG